MRKCIKFLVVSSIIVLAGACSSKETKETVSATSTETAAITTTKGSLSQAEQLLLAQRYEEAVEMLDAIIEEQANNVGAYELRGLSLAKLGKVYPALADLIAVTQMDPSARAYFNLGNALQQMGFCERAVDAYRRVLEQSPNDDQALTNMGAAYICYGQYDQGNATLNQALINNPNNEIALTNLGISFMEKGDFKNAIIYFERATKANPIYAPTYFALYRYYSATGDDGKSKENLRRFVELWPNSKNAKVHSSNL